MAVESGAHPINPFISWKQFNRDNTRTETLLPHQVQPFINCCKADKSEVPRDALLLCLGSGGRIGELMRIKVSDVNLDSKIIKLATTKSQKPQILLLNSFTIDIVKRRMEKATNEWLFPSTRKEGHHISYPRACYERVQARMLALGNDISNLRNHDLRRVFGTLACEKSQNLMSVSRLLHHGSVGVTQRYIQYQDTKLLETSEAVADVLLGN
jgi:integrase